MFLVIAGFVTAYTLRGTRIRQASVGNFCLRRIVRLGVPYWVVVLIVTGLNSLVVYFSGDLSLSGQVTWQRLLSQLTFLQDIVGHENVSAGMWFVGIALQWGLAFILLFGAADRIVRAWSPNRAGEWIVLSVLFLPPALLALFVCNLDSSMEKWIIYFFHMPVFGAVAWWALERRIPAAMFWTYALLLVGGVAFEFRIKVVIALCTGIMLYRAGLSGGIQNWLSFRPLRYLGGISYSLFLIHYPAGWVVSSLGQRLTGDNPYAAVMWLGMAVVASIGAAHVLHCGVERPASTLAARLKPLSMST